MALSRPVAEPILLRDSGHGPFGPLEEIQYLRRQQTRSPPMLVVALNTTGPIAAAEDLVCRQWTDWNQRRPLQVRPTFAVSPNAEYFGRRVLSNGQVVHRSLATNVLRVFPAAEGTGMPYTVACHEFTVHLAAPTSPAETWRLECPYPADKRLHEAVLGMVPPGIDLGFEMAFPTHATSTAPDMLPLLERLHLNQTTNTDDAAVDTLYGQQINAMEPRDAGNHLLSVAATGHRTSGYNIEKRGRRTIASDTENEDAIASESEGVPELVSEAGSIDLGLCSHCLGEIHATNFDCPLYAPRFSENEITAAHALSSLASGRHSLTIQRRKNSINILFLVDVTVLPEMSPEMRRVLDETKGPLQTEWVAPVALRPHETTNAWRELLESFTTEYEEEQEARKKRSEEMLVKELEEGLREMPSGSVADRARAGTPFPHSPAAIVPTHNRTNEPSHTALLEPPVFYRRGQVVNRELWSSSSSYHSTSSSESSNESYDLVDPVSAPGHVAVHERIPTVSPGEWSPAVTEWSVETPDFMFNPTWVIDEAIARALNATVAEPPATASTASSTNATSSSNGDVESGLHAPFHRLPQFTFQPGNSEDVQLALYFWLYDGALKQLDARRFEDDFGSEPAEKALRILHGPLRRFVDYAAMAAEGVHNLQDTAPHQFHPLSPVSEQDVPSDDFLDSVHSPTSLDFSLPTHVPMHAAHATTSPTLPPLVAFSGYVPIEDNHSAEPLESGSESEGGGDATQIGVGIDLRCLPEGVSSPAVDRKRKNPDGDADGEFQQGRRQRAFGKFRGDSLWRQVIENEAFKAAAARAVASASPEDIRYFGGVRLAILAMSHFLEDVCWRLYGIDETAFPDKFPHHPLLHDLEAAKVQTLLSVLQRQGRERLANNLHELLSIRIRNDIADAYLFDPQHLEESFPEQDARYWDLLREPYDTPVTRAEFATRMGFSDSEDEDDSDDEELRLGYPDSEYCSTEEEMETSVRQWIQTAPNYYPRGPLYAVRSGPLVVNRGGVPHSL
ncbi:hypothetical protein K438DRAFT_1959705 [Mycena galopus ATCC 62051]|nr:hypothetical protein K438DRAFT_1959705 [Mycena galopus ATCC 62051]